MDEGAQEDEQFEVEIDNGKTIRSENSSASEDSEEDDDCWKCGSDPNHVGRAVGQQTGISAYHWKTELGCSN